MEETRVNHENYFVVQGWMLSDLGLKNNELLIYAIIYGFSQARGKFTGSLQYLCDWTNSGKTNVQACLKSLREKGLIEKEENIINGVKFCEYYATKCHRVYQKVTGGISESDTNNIDNNKKDNKDTIVAVVNYLNEKIGKNYRATTKSTKSHINARLEEGYVLDDFITVIDKKCLEWLGTEFEQFLRPDTLFGTKFENYLLADVSRRKNRANAYRDNIKPTELTDEDKLRKKYREAMMGLLPEERTPYEEWRKSNG